jgi:hypothetical protein
MYADDTMILNVGQDMNKLQNMTSNNVREIFSFRQNNSGRKVL